VTLGLVAAAAFAAMPAHADPLKVLKRRHNFDGSTQLSVGAQLPISWETKFGMDLGMGASSGQARTIVPNAPQDQSGAAWASMTVPSLPGAIPFERASVEARVDAFREEAKLGTTLSRSVPLGGTLALSLHNGYWLTQNGYAIAHTDPTVQATQIWTADQAVKVKVLPTETTISAGAAINSADGQWLRSLTAEQKLYGGLSVSSGVSETTTGELNKKISAGFRHSW
jgi:hypothetical protein